MQKTLKISILSTLLALFSLLQTSYAKEGFIHQANVGQDITFEYLTVSDGLPDNFVASILQDQQGFIWFGTKSGLSRYDGMEFVTYTYEPDNPQSLSYNFIWHLMEDRNGMIWVGTLGGGLNSFDPKTQNFVRYQHDEGNPNSLSHDFVWFIHEDQNGTLWLATDGGGLNQFDPITKTFIHYQHNETDPKSISHNSVTSIAEDKNGTLWVGTYGGGLNKFDPVDKTFATYNANPANPNSLSDDFIRSIYVDQTGLLWIGTEKGGLNQFDPVTETFVHYKNDEADKHSLSNNIVRSIFEDSNGILWVGTHGGINRFDRTTERFTRYQDNALNLNSISDNTVFCITEDKQQTLWIGTFNGVNKYNSYNERFVHYQQNPQNPNSLNDDQILDIYEDDQGILWLGTKGGGLNRFDRPNGKIIYYQNDADDPGSISGDNVGAIHPDEAGILWIGTHGNGLNKFDPADGSFIRYLHNPNNLNSLQNNAILDLKVDSNNVVWIGMLGGGLDRFDPTTEEFTHHMADSSDSNSLVSIWVRAVTVDNNGMVWVGTEGGVSRFDPVNNIFTNYLPGTSSPASLSSASVYSVFADSKGFIWIGTGDGLNKLDQNSQTITVYRKAQGLADNTVNAILEDDQGFLWVSTNNGLSRFNPNTETFRNYDQGDGLQSNLFLWHSAYKGKTGELFFGGAHGFNSFYPERLFENSYAPPVVLTDFQLFNQPVLIGKDSPLQQSIGFAKQITLDYDESVFGIKFAALNYLVPSKNGYAYKMEGVNKDWVYVNSSNRSANYTSLDPGKYIFRVKASNNDGFWNEDGTSITIVVKPPWWRTIWFQAGFLILFATLIYGGVRWRLKSIRQQNLQLEREVIHRTNALQESEARYRELFNTIACGVAVYRAVDGGKDFVFQEFNHASERMEKITADELLGKRVTEIFPGIEATGLLDTFRQVWQTGEPKEVPNLFYQDDRISSWRDNYVYKLPSGEIVSVYNDVTDRKQTEEELRAAKETAEKLSRTDAITRINNQRAFREWLGHYINANNRNRQPIALGYIDLDNFKYINDSMGHSTGDQVLMTVGSVLLSAVRSSDIVARMGGDEFAVLLPNTDLDGARQLFEKLHKKLHEKMSKNGWKIGFSIGVAIFVNWNKGEDEAITIADLLMYEVKKGTKDDIAYEVVE